MRQSHGWRALGATLMLAATLVGCSGGGGTSASSSGNSQPPASVTTTAQTTPTPLPGSDGPGDVPNPNVHQDGNAVNGKQVFRFETMGNEGFMTDAMRLPQGMVARNVTPLIALQLGMQFDVDNIDSALRSKLQSEVATDLSQRNAPLLNDPKTTMTLISENAVIGMVPFKVSTGAGLDFTRGDKVGASCTLCHAITDASMFALPNGGSIGHRRDGLTNHNLDFGSIIANADNPMAYFPVLQTMADDGSTLGRDPSFPGLTENSTQDDARNYLRNKVAYPVGNFDDSVDGLGDPVHIQPVFRTDLSAPHATEGSISHLDNFSNQVYVALLDPTTLTTPGGLAFAQKFGTVKGGTSLVNHYKNVLAKTGVVLPAKGYFVNATQFPVGEEALLGLRVDNTKLIDMNAYLDSLQAPAGQSIDPAVNARSRQVFRTNCTQCHNVDQGKIVPPGIIPMKTIYPGDNPIVLGIRFPPLDDILHTPGSLFDAKMAVNNATGRGLARGTAMPLLLDLARKPNFLHDSTIPSLDSLLDPSRGPLAPHPFYLSNPNTRAEMVQYLKSLDTSHN